MLSFAEFVQEEGSPIYQQILLYVKRGIVGGRIVQGQELPSRRALSTLLGVNPNTVQKAYRLLEDEGLISSHAGAKSYITLQDSQLQQVAHELLERDIKGLVGALQQVGLTKEMAVELLNQYWE